MPSHVEITADPEQMPAPAQVERLLADASSRLGPSEAATLAQASARMYSWARAIPGAATASAQEGDELVGFGYGYSWDWTTMTDAWSLRLRDRLGGSAAALDESFSVVLLVVAPGHRGSGLGGELLAGLATQADEPLTWLQTGADAPLRALCDALGWRPLDPHADPVIMLGSRT
jgi:GNAT superfamily N-acetyltransferase